MGAWHSHTQLLLEESALVEDSGLTSRDTNPRSMEAERSSGGWCGVEVVLLSSPEMGKGWGHHSAAQDLSLPWTELPPAELSVSVMRL